MLEYQGIKVIGATIGRTGSQSVREALTILDFKCYYMFLADYLHKESWHKIIYEDAVADWSTGIQPFDACVDWPTSAYWKEIWADNPEAFILLTVRDPEEWYDSCAATIFPWFDTRPPEMRYWSDLIRNLLHKRFCDQFSNRGVMIRAYKEFMADVYNSVPPHKLIVWETGSGWEPICEPLGLPIPDQSFPHENNRKTFRAAYEITT